MVILDSLPSYLRLTRAALQERVEAAWALLGGAAGPGGPGMKGGTCRVCPRHCKVDRVADDRRGFCRLGARALVSAYQPHFGEEPPLVGRHGSGTIFFASCNLACVYCQNWETSQLRQGQEVEPRDLALMMVHLQRLGCHNINLVTPSHVVPQILAALPLAVALGLRVPLVYNTGGYDSVEALRLLDGIVDIYMPDIKYADDGIAGRYSAVKGYYAIARVAVKEMHRQVGDLVVEDGMAARGLIIRHLVLPGGLAGTAEVVRFIAQELSPHSYVNVMAQYRPENRAHRYPELSRPITPQEYQEALRLAAGAGLDRLA
ncbi:MAG TPA: radical SAM protein [Dehalococcoidia bacterium]|nr:radical SAM protein [Dehalococcoidia bacterium]